MSKQIYEFSEDHRNCLLKLKNLLSNLFRTWLKYFYNSGLVFYFVHYLVVTGAISFFKFVYRSFDHKPFTCPQFPPWLEPPFLVTLLFLKRF